MSEEIIDLTGLSDEELYNIVDPIFKDAPCDVEGMCTSTQCPYFMECDC